MTYGKGQDFLLGPAELFSFNHQCLSACCCHGLHGRHVELFATYCGADALQMFHDEMRIFINNSQSNL